MNVNNVMLILSSATLLDNLGPLIANMNSKVAEKNLHGK